MDLEQLYILIKDDGEIFNASVDAKDYIVNTAIGGVAGASIGYIAPALGGAAASSYAIAGGEAVAAISGAVVAGAVTAAGIVLFASSNRPGDNQKQNKQFKDAMRELKITNKDKMRRAHDKINGRNMGYNELLDFIREVLKIK